MDTFYLLWLGKNLATSDDNFFTCCIKWDSNYSLDNSIKCKITSITDYDTLDDVFNDIKFDKDDVPFNSLVPNCKNSNEGITKYLNYYKKYESLNNKYLLFGISIVI